MPNQPGFADVACPPWPLLLMSRWPLLARLLARLLAAGLHVCWPLAAAARVRGVSALDHLASCATATSHTADC